MVAAPYVDELLSGHDLASLEEFARVWPPCGDRGRGEDEPVQWSVTVQAARRPRADPRGDRRARRRGRALPVASPPASGRRRTAPSWSSRPTTREAGRSRRGRDLHRRGRTAPGSRLADHRDSARSPRTRTTSRLDGDDPVIRLGSLAGYPFEGPRRAGGLDRCRPSRRSTRPVPARREHASSTPSSTSATARTSSAEPSPVPAPAVAVLDRAGRQQVEALRGGVRGARRPDVAPQADRRGAVRGLPARAATSSSSTSTWKDEWIGDYTAPTTGPLTTGPPATTSG